MSSEKKSELVEATEALNEELEKVEHLAQSAARIPLSSRRNLEKAARTTTEAAEAQTRVGDRIKELMEALNAARVRNEATVQTMQQRSDEIQARSQQLSELLTRFDKIGEEAREISSLAQTVTTEGAGEKLTELESRMAAIAEAAKALWEQADKDDWTDVARDADSLRQQVLAAKNKLGLLAKRIVN